MSLATNGNVGIGMGNSIPGSKLQVSGTATATQFATSYGNTVTTDYGMAFARTAGGFDAPVNSGMGISFTNRQTGGLWAADAIVNRVVANSGGLVTSGMEIYTHDNSSSTSNVMAFNLVGQNLGIGNITAPTSRIDINGAFGYNQLRLRTTYTPTSSSDTNGSTGNFSWDDNYLYIKTSGGWKRTALSTF